MNRPAHDEPILSARPDPALPGGTGGSPRRPSHRASDEQWLWLMEALHPRIKDVALEQRCITPRCGKVDGRCCPKA